MRARLAHLWSTLVHEHTSPTRLALAVWAGVIIGSSPLFGLHFFITVAVGFLLRLNKLVMYAAAQVSIPPLVPFLGFASVQLGHYALKGEWHALALDDFRGLDGAKLFFTDWLVGGFVFGVSVGGLAAAMTYVALKKNTPVQRAIARAAQRYRHAPPKFAWYARIKYRMDPVYVRIAAHVAAHKQTVDLGAGLGMLGVLLAELGDRKTHGIEWDGDKVAAGQLAGASLERGDITQLQTLPKTDVVTIVDVLHYFDEQVIARVLDVAAQALKPGGKLLVREGDLNTKTGAWTRVLENAAVRMGWNKAPAVRFLSREKLVELLTQRGLTVQVEHASGPAHPGNLLFVGLKPE